MNIIGGEKRGAKLAACTSAAVRPTAQRTREALFNILQGGRYAVSLNGAIVIDVFAGTGAIGLEALSRGAGTCVFIEQDRDALTTLTTNINKLGMQDRATVLAQDACALSGWSFTPANLVFADPPYDSPLAGQALSRLAERKAIDKQAVIVVETRKTETCALGRHFTQTDNRTYGMAKLNFFSLTAD